MKKYYSAILILVVILFADGFQRVVRGEDKTIAPQDLQNEKAIEYLKQTNGYNSLAEAVKAVNSENSSESDLFFAQHQKLLGSAGDADDFFGTSVAISGDLAVIGAYGEDIGSNADQGAAYVFVRNGTIWTLQAKLIVFDGVEGDNFGTSVAISGDFVVVGAIGDNVNINVNQGSAYVFVRNGTTWSQQKQLIANDGAANDNFGKSVAISGDTIIVGSYFDQINANTNQGSAYIFTRFGTDWSQETKLIANDGATDDYFGNTVAISSNSVIVGATGDDIGANVNQGSAYIFNRSGTTWTQQIKLIAGDGSEGDYFGTSVDITNTLSGTISVVGAWRDTIGQNFGQGSAYIFNRSQAGVWSQTQKLFAANGGNNDGFGVSVSIVSFTGSAIVVGARFAGNRGAAYIFRRVNSVWTEQQKLTAFDGASGDNFGGSIAISGDTAIVGAYFANIGANADEGAAYVFNLGTTSFDFDGDNKTDISIFRPSNGQWWINRSEDNSTFVATFGLSSDRIMPADFTGDGKTDIAFFRPSTGNWFILRSEDNSFYSFPFGAVNDIPNVGDFDGDSKADVAVFRPSNTTWYINKSSGGTLIQQFGAANDIPAVADYDGDGKADIAIFRPNGASGAEWWRQNSSNNQVFAAQFGSSSDKPVQGDYTGDGKSDIAFWRPSNGNWYILRSEDSSFYAFPFGANGDIPTSGDYDGDGKTDAAVFRPINTTWYVNRSTAGTLIQQFGVSGDKPVPSAFIP